MFSYIYEHVYIIFYILFHTLTLELYYKSTVKLHSAQAVKANTTQQVLFLILIILEIDIYILCYCNTVIISKLNFHAPRKHITEICITAL